MLRTSLAVALVVMTTTGCDDAGDTSGRAGVTQIAPGSASVPAELILRVLPEGAKEVAEVRSGAKSGDTVVVRGRVGGSPSPFVEGRASFQLVDASLKACGEGNPDDKCETPWDFCCEDPKLIAAHSASVQVVGPDGRPLHVGLKGAGGLKPLSEVTVKGTVAKAADSGALVINATGLHVKQ